MSLQNPFVLSLGIFNLIHNNYPIAFMDQKKWFYNCSCAEDLNSGFSVGEEQYTLLSVDEDVLYGKGKEGCSRFIVVR